jgi:hypothetical protein
VGALGADGTGTVGADGAGTVGSEGVGTDVGSKAMLGLEGASVGLEFGIRVGSLDGLIVGDGVPLHM